MTQESVADQLEIPRSAVSEIETGKRELAAVELFALAKLFGESMEQLLGIQEHAPEEELVMLRADEITASSRAELNRFVHLCHEYRQLEEWAGELRDPDLRPPRAILSNYEQAHALADEERKRLDLGTTPAHQLLRVLEDHVGIKILFLSLDEGLSGASVKSPSFGPAILVNRTHPPGRRAFTLAHEYFHLLTQGRVANSKGAQSVHLCESRKPGEKKDRAEQLADQFTGHLLLPRQHFIEQLRRLLREDGRLESLDLIGVARYFGVSVQAVCVQMAALKIVPWEEAKRLYGDPELQEGIVKAGEDKQAPEPTRFKRLAVKAYLAEQVSRSRLAELLEINVADVEDEIRSFGGEEAGRGVKLSLPR